MRPRMSMHQLQELVRLHRMGLSARGSARQLRMSRNTVRAYLSAFSDAGLLDGPVDDLPAVAALRDVLPKLGRRPLHEQSSVHAWAALIEPMQDRGAGAKAIFDTLRRTCPEFDGSYDAVKRFCRRRRRRLPPRAEDIVIPVVTAPGDVAQVDFFYVGKLLDPAAGKLRKCWAFTMVLADSRHMFVDLVFDQRILTWLRVHNAAFRWFGGVPAVVVPDNLKSAVIRGCFSSSDDIELNRSYAELARYYGFQIDPAPVYSPEKKGKVERAGQYFRDNYLVPLGAKDIHAAKAGITTWLLDIAGMRIHGTTGERPIEAFRDREQAFLKPLPTMPFETVVWKRAKVHRDSHIQFDRCLYSVPWTLTGQQVWVRGTEDSLVVYANQERVATHQRRQTRGRTTVQGHLPDRRAQWANRGRQYWEEEAGRLGDDVFIYVCELFDDDDALLPLRKVQSICTFLKDYPLERRNGACRRARHFGVTQVRMFKNILLNDLDKEPLHGLFSPNATSGSPPRFARGATFFTNTIPEA